VSYDADFLTQMAEEQLGGGGSFTTTGLVKVEFGVKVYLTGVPQSESFFPFSYGDPTSVAAAVQKANAKILESGEQRRPQMALRFTVMKDSVLETKQDGTKTSDSWKEDRTYDVQTVWWNKDTRQTESYPTFAQLIRPSLDKFVPQEDLGKWLCLQLGSEVDFTNPERKNQFNEKIVVDESGETTVVRTPKKNYVPVVVRRFESEEDARAFVAGGEAAVTKQPERPADWNDDYGTWADMYPWLLNQLEVRCPDENTPLPKVNKVIADLVNGCKPESDEDRTMLTAAVKSVQEFRVGVPF
jgi:hypothetical protein